MRRRENPRNYSSYPHLPIKIMRSEKFLDFSPSPHFDWRQPKGMCTILPIFISIMKMRSRENPRKFFPSLHFLLKMRRREIYSLGGGLLVDEEKGESKEFFLFSPFTYQN